MILIQEPVEVLGRDAGELADLVGRPWRILDRLSDAVAEWRVVDLHDARERPKFAVRMGRSAARQSKPPNTPAKFTNRILGHYHADVS